jgi:hypothetical protein
MQRLVSTCLLTNPAATCTTWGRYLPYCPEWQPTRGTPLRLLSPPWTTSRLWPRCGAYLTFAAMPGGRSRSARRRQQGQASDRGSNTDRGNLSNSDRGGKGRERRDERREDRRDDGRDDTRRDSSYNPTAWAAWRRERDRREELEKVVNENEKRKAAEESEKAIAARISTGISEALKMAGVAPGSGAVPPQGGVAAGGGTQPTSGMPTPGSGHSPFMYVPADTAMADRGGPGAAAANPSPAGPGFQTVQGVQQYPGHAQLGGGFFGHWNPWATSAGGQRAPPGPQVGVHVDPNREEKMPGMMPPGGRAVDAAWQFMGPAASLWPGMPGWHGHAPQHDGRHPHGGSGSGGSTQGASRSQERGEQQDAPPPWEPLLARLKQVDELVGKLNNNGLEAFRRPSRPRGRSPRAPMAADRPKSARTRSPSTNRSNSSAARSPHTRHPPKSERRPPRRPVKSRKENRTQRTSGSEESASADNEIEDGADEDTKNNQRLPFRRRRRATSGGASAAASAAAVRADASTGAGSQQRRNADDLETGRGGVTGGLRPSRAKEDYQEMSDEQLLQFRVEDLKAACNDVLSTLNVEQGQDPAIAEPKDIEEWAEWVAKQRQVRVEDLNSCLKENGITAKLSTKKLKVIQLVKYAVALQ